ncbi:hypothetical protein EHS25_000815 [Saitozyma podzolica]|uniref:FAD/NAD(P)-binding domain-containing protein n=1 Tax=Saitozyma podzolica TaxID=1890683 RepID=A0A427YXB3_9TREE|nr:hypothetical protein EHS25_000815 [Saitozyma podzolica]
MGPQIPLRVVIVGAGPVGLCNARTLLDDGFDVTIVTADDGVGGVWRHTFPELGTNSPWGSFTFSGLEMPKPPGDGSTIPAGMYCEYLEEFYSHFVKPRATSWFHTKVMTMEPGKAAGWDLVLESPDGTRTEHFDRVVLAVGSLGKPHLPQGISNTVIPTFHSQDVSFEGVQSVLSLLAPSDDLPSTQGDADTVLVVGTGKSAIDNAVLFAKQRRKVLMVGRSFKWMSAPVKPDFIGSEWLTAVMGPVRNLDSRTQWFLHCTTLGGLIVSTAWSVLKKKYVSHRPDHPIIPHFDSHSPSLTSSAVLSCLDSSPILTQGSLYGPEIVQPKTNIHLDMPRFSVGLTPEFTDLVSSGRIAILTGADVVGADDKAVILTMADGSERRVRCGAIIAATGFKGSGKEFLAEEWRDRLGLTRQPMRLGWRGRVKSIRKGWGSVRPTAPIVDREIDLPLVYRGIVPIGRYTERDLVVAGGSTIVYKPAVLYEAESHLRDLRHDL